MITQKAYFYLLPESALDTAMRYACRLAEKSYQDGKKIYIHSPSRNESQRIDDLLWTFHDISFLPHAIYDDQPNTNTRILIGDTADINIDGDLLINLTAEIPKFHTNFKAVMEIIPNDEAAKIEARKRYKIYQRQGYQINSFDLTKSQRNYSAI